MARLPLVLLSMLVLGGCSANASEEEDTGAVEGAASSARDRTRDSSTYKEVWLFGGKNADVRLGCLTCSDYSSDSILSSHGYGSSYGDTIWNPYSQYGSDHSDESPWYRYADHPPRLYSKDRSEFYGNFTVRDLYSANRTHLDVALEILAKGRDNH